jgi:hypothetical protein
VSFASVRRWALSAGASLQREGGSAAIPAAEHPIFARADILAEIRRLRETISSSAIPRHLATSPSPSLPPRQNQGLGIGIGARLPHNSSEGDP